MATGRSVTKVNVVKTETEFIHLELTREEAEGLNALLRGFGGTSPLRFLLTGDGYNKNSLSHALTEALGSTYTLRVGGRHKGFYLDEDTVVVKSDYLI